MTLYKRVAALPAQTVGGDLLVVDAERDLFFSSNPVGAFIWNMLESPATQQDVTNAVVAEFEGATEAAAAPDVQEFIDAMVSQGLVAAV